MSGDALMLKMYSAQIQEAKEQAFFNGYVEGKKVIRRWAANCERLQKENPEQ